MFYRKLATAALALPFIFFLNAFSQTNQTSKPDEKQAETKKQAVQFLRETFSDVNSLRTLENRISFSSEMAGLMWFEDEKEGRAMYQTVIADFKQLLMQYDAQMAALGVTPDKGGSRLGLMTGLEDETEKSRLTLKFSKAMGVRRQIALSLAEHAPELAFGFFSDTLTLLTNPKYRDEVAGEDKTFELQLIKEIARHDPTKALDYTKKNMAGGVGYAHLELLKKIYDRDADKGVALASEIVAKLKSSKVDPDNLWTLRSALQMGAESLDQNKTGGKKSMFAEADLRDLAELMAQSILARQKDENADFSGSLPLIERFAPARAVQIKAKFPPKAVVKKPEDEDPDDEFDQLVAARTASTASTEKALAEVEKVGGELSKEERAKAVETSRKTIAELPTRQAKITAYSGLAVQVAKAGDRELAAEIMRDAQALVNPAPKHYRDYLETWMLINGLAEADPEKAFPVLDETIYRLNGTLEAFIKVAEFIDVAGEIIDDGELQVGSFGGSMIREVTGSLTMADGMIRQLTAADFGKMKAVTGKFERTEIRVLAKMLVLRAVLGSKQAGKEESMEEMAEEMAEGR